MRAVLLHRVVLDVKKRYTDEQIIGFLREADKGDETVFIRFGDKGSPEPAFLSQLGQAHPGLHLSPWSDRPEEDPACKLTEVLD